MLHANLKRLLQPGHIAFVGGTSMVPAIDICLAAGFDGQIWPVNPNHDNLAGLPTFPTVGDLPEAPDATFLYVNRDVVIDVVGDLSRMGAGGVVCHAAGFGELGGGGGEDYHRALIEAAGDLAVVGPNSNGILNNLDDVMLWPINSHVPEHRDSGVAIITQSGGIAFNYIANQRSVHAAYVISTGNEASLELLEIVDYLIEDRNTRVVLAFLEGTRSPDQLVHVASKAAAVQCAAAGHAATGLGDRVAQHGAQRWRAARHWTPHSKCSARLHVQVEPAPCPG